MNDFISFADYFVLSKVSVADITTFDIPSIKNVSIFSSMFIFRFIFIKLHDGAYLSHQVD